MGYMVAKILKVLGVLLGLLVLAIAGVWFVLLRAPSPEDQCAHVISLMDQKMAGFSASPPGQEWLSTCPEKMKKGEYQGQAPYAKRAKCIMAAASMDDVDACSN